MDAKIKRIINENIQQFNLLVVKLQELDRNRRTVYEGLCGLQRDKAKIKKSQITLAKEINEEELNRDSVIETQQELLSNWRALGHSTESFYLVVEAYELQVEIDRIQVKNDALQDSFDTLALTFKNKEITERAAITKMREMKAEVKQLQRLLDSLQTSLIIEKLFYNYKASEESERYFMYVEATRYKFSYAKDKVTSKKDLFYFKKTEDGKWFKTTNFVNDKELTLEESSRFQIIVNDYVNQN